MQVEIDGMDRDLKDEVELLMAKYDMTENEFVCFLFQKCFVARDFELNTKVADMVLTGKIQD